jgi:hypothetical protein
MNEPEIYGVLAEFAGPEELVHGAEELERAGYRQVESYSPFAVEGMAHALNFRPIAVAVIFLICGVLGAVGGYLMQVYASVITYPENIGGRPLQSWPSFIPITFEMGVLGGVLGGIFGMLLLNKLPRYSHPVSNVARFRAASSDAFFLCVEATDPRFQPHRTADLLREVGAIKVTEVPK